MSENDINDAPIGSASTMGRASTDRRAERPARRAGRWRLGRWLVAGALALAIVGGGSALTASPAQAVAIGTVACETKSMRHATYNAFGQITHGVTNSVKVCAKLHPYGWRLLEPTTSASHQEAYLWNWVGWNGNYKSGGAGTTSFTYYVKGTFKECASYCFHSASNWVKQTATIKNPQNVNIGGTYGMDIVWSVSGGS